MNAGISIVFAAGILLGGLLVFLAGNFALYAFIGVWLASLVFAIKGFRDHDRFWKEWHGTPPKTPKDGAP